MAFLRVVTYLRYSNLIFHYVHPMPSSVARINWYLMPFLE